MIIEIKRKHFLKSEGYMSIDKCPLALALQEHFKNDDITVGGFLFTYNNEDYVFNDELWEQTIVESKIEEAQKCLKNKKKFNSVFLELTKQ